MRMEVKFYVASFFDERGSVHQWGEQSMCFKGIRKPDPDEAEFFLRPNCAGFKAGMKVVEIYEISDGKAHVLYDLTNAGKWPVFGLHNPTWFEGREELSDKDLETFVSMWFKNYETTGFRDTFQTPYSDYRDKEGLPFEVVGRVQECDCDLECLPKWIIRFKDGSTIEAYPEEIAKIESEVL